jgi:hypothetical protein
MKKLAVLVLVAVGMAAMLGAQAFTAFASGQAISASDMNNDFIALVPVGTIIASLVPPTGSYMTGSTVWAYANGTKPADATAYTGLFPDLRGQFLRGVDGGSGHDPNAATRTAASGGTVAGAGSSQADAFQSHKHYLALNGSGTTTGWGLNAGASSQISVGSGYVGGYDADTGGAPRTASETRPTNIAVYWYIRVK